MKPDIESLVLDLLAGMKELGINAKVTYCINQAGKVISFEVKIIGYSD